MNLVTGATGILGSHVVLALLRDGQPVRACYRREEDKHKVLRLFSYYTAEHQSLYSRVQWHKVDITDIFSVEDALDSVDCVYHCAGYVSFQSIHKKLMLKINEEGTRNVINACLHMKVQSLCHVSSLATLHNLDYHTARIDENTFWKKSGRESDYAISKYNAEREVWRAMEEGLQAVIVNPGVILGPGFWTQSSSRIFQTAFKGNPFYTEGTTGYIGAPDVANTMLRLVKEKKFGRRFLLVENNYSFREIFTWINRGLGKKAPWLKLNRWMMHAGRLIERAVVIFTGKEPVLSNAVINSAFNRQHYNNDLIKKELEIEFEPVKTVIEKSCQIYLKEHGNGRSSI